MLYNFQNELDAIQLQEIGSSYQMGGRTIEQYRLLTDAVASRSVPLVTNEAVKTRDLIRGITLEHIYVPPPNGAFVAAVETDKISVLTEHFTEVATASTVKWAELERLVKEIGQRLGLVKEDNAEPEPVEEEETPAVEEESPAVEEEEPEPVPEEEPAPIEEAELAESSLGHAAVLEEQDGAPVRPLRMTIEMIQPGWGNEQDKNYYPKEVLEREAAKFVGAKMYETDHKPNETTNRTWVSTILAQKGFSKAGAPIMEVLVHDPNFAERARNLQEGGILDKLECSIRARGMVRPGRIGERHGKIVEQIVDVQSVDWVTRAGAGGKAANILESEEGTVEPEPVEQEPVIKYMGESQVAEILEAATLPEVVVTRLVAKQYLDKEAVLQAIQNERAYLQEAVGAPRVTSMGEAVPAKATLTTVSMEEVHRRQDEVNAKWMPSHHRTIRR